MGSIIINTYIPSHLPSEYANYPIEICICFGGDLKESIRLSVTQYEERYKNGNLSFSQWGGDRLTLLIEKYFLNEKLLPGNFQSMLRKSLALIDEPEASHQHFSKLVYALSNVKEVKNKVKALRQLRISLGVLITWCEEADNLESAYLSAELLLLHAWELAKSSLEKKTRDAAAIQDSLQSVVSTYLFLCHSFSHRKIIMHIDKKYVLSQATHPTNRADTNLKLFDLLGRIALQGIWLQCVSPANSVVYYSYVKGLIVNNPMLLTPYKDEQVIDIAIAIYFLMQDENNMPFIHDYLWEVLNRINFNFNTHSNYPCTIDQYHQLIEHPLERTDEYRTENTKASILYSYIAFFSAHLGFDDIYEATQNFISTKLNHCNVQLWYPNENSEKRFYLNSEIHGCALNKIFVHKDKSDLLEQIYSECEQMPFFYDMSAVKFGFYPLIFLGCRHYRLPIPMHFFYSKKTQDGN